MSGTQARFKHLLSPKDYAAEVYILKKRKGVIFHSEEEKRMLDKPSMVFITRPSAAERADVSARLASTVWVRVAGGGSF